MSDHPGLPKLSLALRSVIGTAVDGDVRTGLLSVVQPADDPDGSEPRVVPFPAPRRPLDDGPSGA